MIRRSCGLALLAAALALGVADAGNPTRYSGVTTMTFQNGVAPTVGYAGCEDTFLKEADIGRNWGNSNYIRCGGDGIGGQEYTPLIKFDISALPDSAVIIQARLWFYQASTVAIADSPELAVYRSYYPWTEGSGSDSASTTSAATWTTRVSGSNWTLSGAQSESATNASATWQASGSDTATVGTVFVGSDTLNHVSVIGLADRPKDAIHTRLPRASAATLSRKGWFSMDVTHQVELWHNGANTNNGFIIQADETGFAVTGVLWWYSSEWSYKLRRPKLEITYFDPTAGSSGSGTGRQIIGFPWDYGPR